jgi:aryl-alcohol dehydrogenase-like predicted oxidoreductase
MPTSDPRSVPSRRVDGLPLSLSLLGFTVVPPPAPSPTGDRAVVQRLRRARRAGVTTFDVGGSQEPARAELLLAEAFPTPDPEIAVVVGRRAEDMSARIEVDRQSLEGPDGSAERLRRSVEESRRRLSPLQIAIVEWSGGLEDDLAHLGPAPLGPSGPGTPLIYQRLAGPSPRIPARDPEPGWPLLLSGTLSLLEPQLSRTLNDLGTTGRLSFLAHDPLAGGRLDGTRFSAFGIERGPESGPTRLRDLEAEFAPVLRLGHLTRSGERTLAQAAIQYVSHWTWVSSVITPLPTGERLEEVLGTFDAPPLREDELGRVGIPTGHDPRRWNGARPGPVLYRE